VQEIVSLERKRERERERERERGLTKSGIYEEGLGSVVAVDVFDDEISV
jgi:hypothetical protein